MPTVPYPAKKFAWPAFAAVKSVRPADVVPCGIKKLINRRLSNCETPVFLLLFGICKIFKVMTIKFNKRFLP